MHVNKTIRKPVSPAPHVTDTTCTCGASYEAFNSSITFTQAANMVRHHNGEEEGGGYRSRGPVLWMMRCFKLELWFEAHRWCGK